MPQLNSSGGCTLSTCPLSLASVSYQPSLFGNAFFLAIYGLLFLLQTLQGYKYKTWIFGGAMMAGLVIECVGYVGRVQMHYNPFLGNPFLIYIVCLTIAPVFFAAAIYLTLSRIIVHYSPQYSRFSPKTISLTFMSCDFIALVLQGTGGALADTASDIKGRDQGTHIMVGGLAFQVLTLLVFMAVAAEFALGVRKAQIRNASVKVEAGREGSAAEKKKESGFKLFLVGSTLATIFILTRSIFRVAELAKGFQSKLANEEIPFMVLEGGMITLATTCLTIAHPGRALRGKWGDAGWKWGKDKTVRKEDSPRPESLLENGVLRWKGEGAA